MRDLRVDEVEFTLEIEPEDLDLRGNVLACGDDAEDKKAEDEIRDRLNRGDDTAWCCLVVKATWIYELNGEEHTVKGFDSLGGCTIGEKMMSGTEVEKEAWELANAHAMKDSALDDLNRRLRAIVKDAKTIETQLTEFDDDGGPL